MISHELRCVFLHPQKCGGKAVESALFGVEPAPYSADHRTLRDHLAEHGQPLLDRYFKFVFCRNPWARLVSVFHGRRQILKDPACIDNDFRAAFHLGVLHKPQQVEFIIDGHGRPDVDFVARLERVDEEWPIICSRLGISVPLPRANRSQHGHYSTYYDDEMREIVAARYHHDIEFHGYTFDADASSRQAG